MTYASMANLSNDPGFTDRVLTCCTEQALVFVNDGRDDIAALARSVIATPKAAMGLFELVCVAPGMGDVGSSAEIDDATILSSVQAAWPTYAGVLYPPVPSP